MLYSNHSRKTLTSESPPVISFNGLRKCTLHTVARKDSSVPKKLCTKSDMHTGASDPWETQCTFDIGLFNTCTCTCTKVLAS